VAARRPVDLLWKVAGRQWEEALMEAAGSTAPIGPPPPPPVRLVERLADKLGSGAHASAVFGAPWSAAR
jgi:hypothetical protein